ncbi:MAG: trypsin-like peptidase domain-containing protein, partial [Clostridia bacterium]|nr:trypsin-like peptidase domain-containing protein [Clostridia bacterium]
VLLSCVAMATVIGLFAGVLLSNRYLLTRDAAAAAVDAPEQAPQAVATAVPAPALQSNPAAKDTAEANDAVVKSDGFAHDGTFTRAQICEIAAPSVVGIDIVSPVTYWGQTYEAEGSGSGVILTEDGYIATCAHVVENASKIKVYLNDDTEYEATLVGQDKRNDIAIIKIDAANLTAAEIGDSDMLTVGEDVIAIGNPLGELRGTATSGIISALRRPVTVENSEMELVQTDAAISPGNSGGGLFNASGKLIGIVNAKASGNNAEGLGFAIPINNVLTEINDLLNYGYIKGRAYLGVSTQNVSLRSDYGFWSYSSVSCVQVVDVAAGSAAEAAGIQINDLILAVNETRVTSNSDLSDMVSSFNAGDTAKITLQRAGRQMEVTVTFGEYVPQQ